MQTFYWILLFGFLMSIIALVGSFTLMLGEEIWNIISVPLISFAAGSLIGGAMFHMIPHAVEKMGNTTSLYIWILVGYVLFYIIEVFLNWHHSHTHSHDSVVGSNICPRGPIGRSTDETTINPERNSSFDGFGFTGNNRDGPHEGGRSFQIDSTTMPFHDNDSEQHQTRRRRRPIVNLILVADAVHNFLGGMFIGASFVDSISLGLAAWLAAAIHEVPQELGDFAILVHGGCTKREALIFNFLSALTFPLGGCIAYFSSSTFDVSFLIPFAAGNFLYIGCSDLIPEVKHSSGIKKDFTHCVSFLTGIGVMLGVRIAFEGW